MRSERAALADDLEPLDEDALRTPSLCGRWTVEDVLAHLAAAATIGRFRWLASMAEARFDADLHNQRRLTEGKGATPKATLANFRRVVDSRTVASGHMGGWLGEVVVHAQDIRRPLGLPSQPAVTATSQVATFFARRDFAVASHSAARGLRLEATDGPFAAGDGPAVTGPTLALTMAMAGRAPYLDVLYGPGLPTLRSRIQAA